MKKIKLIIKSIIFGLSAGLLFIILMYIVTVPTIENLKKSVNPVYLEGIKEVAYYDDIIDDESYTVNGVTYHNKCGSYNPNNQTIQLNRMYGLYYLVCWNDMKTNFLHELKHHYCYTHGFDWNNFDDSHQGCFLNTPIDKEYGFIE